MVVFTIKYVSGSLRWTRIDHFHMQNAIFNFLRKVQFWLILTDFGGFFHLRGQFLEPQLYPIVLAMKRAIVRHILRNISGSGKVEIGAGTPELQGKTSDFQKIQLWDQISPLYASSFWIPPDHVVYPPRSPPGTWNFWASYTEKNNRAAGAKICDRPYLARASR